VCDLLIFLPRCEGEPTPHGRFQFGLYKIFVYFESFVHESIVLSFFRPGGIAHTVTIILLHDDWAIYDPRSTCLLYAMHHTILVITISF